MGHSEVDVDFQCILGFQSQSIDFKIFFDQAYITRGEVISVELSKDFKSDGVKFYVVIR